MATKIALNSQARIWTDKTLEELEKRISREFKRASEEITAKMQAYLDKFAKQDAVMLAKLKAGEITQKELKEWRINHFMIGKNWQAMKDTIAQDILKTDLISAKMVNDALVDVYTMNANYAYYELERNMGGSLAFDLYNRTAVENLMAENPDFMPHYEPKAPIVGRWNKQHITSEMVQGIIQGESIKGIAKRMQKVTNMDKNASIRNARTYTTSVENKARLDRYLKAEEMGIEQMKYWESARDGRVRDSHRAVDGEIVPLKEPFSNGLMQPADPSGSPSEVYNCRCVMFSIIKGHEYECLHPDEIEGIPYEEWKKGKQKKQKAEETTDTWVDKIKEIQKKEHLTEADIKEAGKIVSEQVHKGYLDDIKKAKEQGEKDLIALKTKYKADEMAVENLLSDEKYGEARRIVDGYNVASPKYFKNEDDAREFYRSTREKVIELREIANKSYDDYVKQYYAVKTGSLGDSADKFASVLGQVREVGANGINIKAHLNNSRSVVRGSIEWAYNHYPTDWVKASVDAGNLTVKKVSRGYYSKYSREIAISGEGFSANKTAVHELGHRFEHTITGMLDAEKEFYERRTAGEELQWLGRGYRRDEKSRFDNFVLPYMGKDYQGTAYELVSMGFEYAYTDPLKLAKDEDMEQWIYGLLAVK